MERTGDYRIVVKGLCNPRPTMQMLIYGWKLPGVENIKDLFLFLKEN
jgi:hypothetical protein